jgi:hypothetical protein
VFGVLLLLLLLLLILGFWLFQQHQAGCEMAEYLENVFERAGTRIQSMAKTAVDTISKLQTRLKGFETRHRDDQETIKQLRDGLDTSQSENADLRTDLRSEKEVRQQEAEQAFREKNKNSNTRQKSAGMGRMRRKLVKERKSKARVIERLKAINQERNVARDEAQKREQELEQNVKHINAQVASDKKELNEKLSEKTKCDKLSKEQCEAAKQEIQTQKDKMSALSDKNAATEHKCAKLEQDNKNLKAANQQHQNAHSKLIIEHEKLSRNQSEATERADRLQRENEHAKKLRAETSLELQRVQRQLATANKQIQNKDAEISTARQEKAKLTEHFNNEAKIAAAKAQKPLQEEQSENKIQQDQADKVESQIQDLKADIKDFQQKLELEVEAKDKEATRATKFQQELHDSLQTTVEEQNKSARETREYEQKWKECMKEANEQIEELCQTSKGLRARLVNAESDLETAAEQREELCAAKAKIETLRNECDILRDERRELEQELRGFYQDRHAALDAHDEAQPRQNDNDAPGKADEALDSCHDHWTDQTPREHTEREDDLHHNEIAAFDKGFSAEDEIEQKEAEGTINGDGHNDKPSQHLSSEGDSDGEDNVASHPLQLGKSDDGNSESVNHGDFDRAAVDQQRKARRRAKNQDMNRGGTEARKNREARFHAAEMERTQAQQIPHEQQAPVTAVNSLQPVVDGPNLLQPAQQQVESHGGRQHPAHAQHWNDFASVAQQKYDNRSAPAQQPAVRMPPSGPRFPASNGFRGGRRGMGRGKW